MMEKLKQNTKIKIIALLSAVVLWMYVMAVVDPEDTILYENIPITITNLNEIKDLDLVIDPDEKLATSVYVTGKLSDLKNVNSDNIDVYGTINSPIEGNNQLYLRATTRDKVSTDFKSSTIVVKLEKIVREEKVINVEVTGRYKDNVDQVNIKDERIIISGPRSKVNEVKYVQADLVMDKQYSKAYNEELNLTALDEDKQKVDNIELEFPRVEVEVSFLQQKQVSVNPVFSNTSKSLVKGEDFELSEDVVTIKGKEEVISDIEYVNTEEIDPATLSTEPEIVDLTLPTGITLEGSEVSIRLINNTSLHDRFVFLPSEINLLNNLYNASIADFDTPDDIVVSIEYGENEEKISKDDIKLFVDLEEGMESGKSYSITTNNIDVENVKITPESITVR